MIAHVVCLPRTRTIDSNSGGVIVPRPCYSETKFFLSPMALFPDFFRGIECRPGYQKAMDGMSL